MKNLFAFIILCSLCSCIKIAANGDSNTNLAGPPPPPSNFGPVNVTLSATEGGIVTPFMGTRIVPNGQIILLHAAAVDGYIFSHWEGIVSDPLNADTQVNPVYHRVILAVFIKIYNT